MKNLFVILTIVITISIAFPVLAQDSVCTSEQWAEFSATLGELVDTLAASSTPLDDLLAIRIQIETVRTICNAGVFTKADYPNGIIGPINFGGTLYQATLESVGSVAALSRVEIAGDCDFIISIITPFSGGSESALWEFEDCQAMFEINASTADDWTLTIERLR